MADQPGPGQQWPPVSAVLVLRAIRWGISGALAGAALAIWLALSHRVPQEMTGVIGVDMPLGCAGLAAGARLWLGVWLYERDRKRKEAAGERGG